MPLLVYHPAHELAKQARRYFPQSGFLTVVLDKKIATEIYLKEKKDAIIEDRKEPQKDVETESNLDKVRAKYQDLMKSVEV